MGKILFFVRCWLVVRPVDGDWGSSQAARDLVAHATCNRLRPRKVHQGWTSHPHRGEYKILKHKPQKKNILWPRKVHQGWTCHGLPPGGHISTTTKKLYHPPAVMTRDQQGISGVMPWCFLVSTNTSPANPGCSYHMDDICLFYCCCTQNLERHVLGGS